MNLIARMPSVVSFLISLFRYEDRGKSVMVDDRSRKLNRFSRTGYSKMDRGIDAGLTAKSIAKQLGPPVKEATAPFQYALSTQSGCECVAHVL